MRTAILSHPDGTQTEVIVRAERNGRLPASYRRAVFRSLPDRMTSPVPEDVPEDGPERRVQVFRLTHVHLGVPVYVFDREVAAQ